MMYIFVTDKKFPKRRGGSGLGNAQKKECFVGGLPLGMISNSHANAC